VLEIGGSLAHALNYARGDLKAHNEYSSSLWCSVFRWCGPETDFSLMLAGEYTFAGSRDLSLGEIGESGLDHLGCEQ